MWLCSRVFVIEHSRFIIFLHLFSTSHFEDSNSRRWKRGDSDIPSAEDVTCFGHVSTLAVFSCSPTHLYHHQYSQLTLPVGPVLCFSPESHRPVRSHQQPVLHKLYYPISFSNRVFFLGLFCLCPRWKEYPIVAPDLTSPFKQLWCCFHCWLFCWSEKHLSRSKLPVGPKSWAARDVCSCADFYKKTYKWCQHVTCSQTHAAVSTVTENGVGRTEPSVPTVWAQWSLNIIFISCRTIIQSRRKWDN